MKIYKDFDINTFEAWSGAVDTQETIINEGKAELFNCLVEDIFPDGTTETGVNDLLWHDSSYVYELLEIEEE